MRHEEAMDERHNVSSAFRKCLELDRWRLFWRFTGRLDDEAEDRLLEQLDDLWWQMDERERDLANREGAKLARHAFRAGLQTIIGLAPPGNTAGLADDVSNEAPRASTTSSASIAQLDFTLPALRAGFLRAMPKTDTRLAVTKRQDTRPNDITTGSPS